jgi:hypothetical protein
VGGGGGGDERVGREQQVWSGGGGRMRCCSESGRPTGDIGSFNPSNDRLDMVTPGVVSVSSERYLQTLWRYHHVSLIRW